MLLLIDIGNTSTTVGFDQNGEIKNILRLRTIPGGRKAEEFSYIINGFIRHHQMPKPEGAALCSVVPAVTPLLQSAIETSFGIKLITVRHDVKTGLQFSVKRVEDLGPDRIANAAAAYKLYKGDVIVVDFGTATTLCVVSEKGEYRGGAIMPGLGLSVNALAEKTAKLPVVELKVPKKILGKDTAENIRTGVILGHAGAVDRIIHEIKTETGKDFIILVTGGFADLVKPYLKAIDYANPFLTLEGLRIIYEMNSNN